ncbi:PPE domain-containing protein [Actinokineospora enzanensis]|uniref:PPE domain-containing protein n=1 Tax=Actinokineospora enzanensis TaxID=155975 RepID=UPI00037E109B|nr:PPE domain-containing protein [Actinokineospora enzanensis]
MTGLGDLRFEGYGYEELAEQLDLLRGGPGAESLHRAVTALLRIAKGLAQIDHDLRQQLMSIGVYWEGAAADQGVQATQNASVFASDAVPNVAQSAGGVSQQGDSFSTTRNAAPDGQDLRGATQTTFVDRTLGAFGLTTDHAAEVERTRAAHQQAAAAMNNYARGSQSALNNFQALPIPPGLNLVSQSTTPQGVTSPGSVTTGQSAYTPGGSTGGFGMPGAVTTGPGGQVGSFSGTPGVGGFSPVEGGLQPGTPGTPGVPGIPGTPVGGRVSGVGPVVPGFPGMPNSVSGMNGIRPGFPGGLMGDIAAVAGIAGAGGAGAAAGASLEKDRLVRGGKGAVEGSEASRRMSALAEAPEEQARAARNAERLAGGKAGRSSSLMQPAAGAGVNGEEDDEHVRKYGIDSEDVFGDERLVVAPVLGEDD